MAPGTDAAEALRAGEPAAGMAETSGTRTHFGKYRIHRMIARGGMGEVYLASLVGELGFEKRLVIKTILPRFAAEPRFIELFAAEARTTVALSHGNIVPIYELGRADDTFYIVMGYVDGPSVAELLTRCRETARDPDPKSALHIIRGVLTGLAYAHTDEPGRPAVVHRDITPRNVLLDRSGQVRIVDFGIALPAHVQVNLRAGSTGYVAPEQARAEAADPRADVFSTACLLYELCTHRAAFPREGVWTTPDLADVPELVREPLAAALAIDPDRRPPNAGAFLELLGPAIAKEAATFSDPALAAHLRAVFPDGWSERATSNPSGDAIEAITKIAPKTQTFATRLTAVTSVTEEPGRPTTDAELAPDGTASAPEGSVVGRPVATAEVSLTGSASRSMVVAAARSPWSSFLIGVSLTVVVLLFALPRLGGERSPTPDSVTPSAPPAPIDAPPPAETNPPPHDRTPVVEPVPEPVARRHHLLHVHPADAEVLVDDVVLSGSSPHELSVDEGAVVRIVVRAPGFGSKSLSWSEDAALPGAVTLEKLRPKGNGFLRVTAPTVSWAEVFVDGKKRGSTPTRALALPVGNHRVKVRCIPDACPSERVLYDKTIKIDLDTTTEISAR